MTDADKPQFKAKYAQMAAALGGPADRAGASGYWTALMRCELQDVLGAGDWYLEHGSGDERFPMPRAPQWVAKARELAMSRAREREQRTKDCPLCHGDGWMPAVDDKGVSRLRRCECRGGPLPAKPGYQKPTHDWQSTAEAVARFQARQESE